MTSGHPSLTRRAVRELHELPLRLRLAALLVALLMAALVVTGAAATYQLRSFLQQQQDTELQVTARDLVAAAVARPQSTAPVRPAVASRNGYVVRLQWTPTTSEDYFRSGTDRPRFPELQPGSPRVRTGRPFTVGSLQSDTQWRVVAGTATVGGRTIPYAVALSQDRVHDTVDRLAAIVALAGLIALLACAVLGWFAVRRALRPLRRIQDTARAIAAGDLTQRIPVQNTRDEVAGLAQSLNRMLTRIEESFAARRESEERMRRFVADASHELRTPLASVRGYAELYRMGAVTSTDDVASAMRRIEEEATRLGLMVDELLLLTRLDEHPSGPGDPPRPFAPVDLMVLAADAVQDTRARAPGRTVRMTGLSGPLRSTMVSGDEAGLRQVLTNLLANAVRYTPEGTDIEVMVGLREEAAHVVVRDHGPGVGTDLRERVFERFFRADAARNSAHGGSGLGLAIVSAIVAAHRGSVDLSETPGGGATFTVQIPSIAQQAHSDDEGPAQSTTEDFGADRIRAD
ncbi:HAMP domain-containing sensor histidine kinase [Allobranchiibius huperziae]|uniref:histidine kinase n=1 Tax=Allobranchiibius huperziae TaxID=1874116 RepID=A0A853DHA9_9MICO|nr:two-component system OmpR family sensor kinase [Allobranchiibius huperziae]